jgi:hypothetical protein
LTKTFSPNDNLIRSKGSSKLILVIYNKNKMNEEVDGNFDVRFDQIYKSNDLIKIDSNSSWGYGSR